MEYKIVGILADMSDLSLYKVPIELYEEISDYLGRPFPEFQKLYDELCKDEESQDIKLVEFYRKIEEDCEYMDCDLIQVY